MILQPLLIALVVGAGSGPGPEPPPRVSYRARVTLDEGARLLRGTVEIVVRGMPGGTAARLGMRVRNATLTRLRATAGAAESGFDGSAAWTFPRALGASDSLVLEGEFTAPDLGPPDPPGSRDVPGPDRPDGPDRRFDFHAWLPAVVEGAAVPVVGSFLVRLDVPEDQVVAATGVPLCGDPGWTAARLLPRTKVTLRRDAYPTPGDPAARALAGEACAPAAPGRKTVVWYAEDVRDLALTMDPAFRYEEGDLLERPVRGLFAPASERTWGAGLAVRRTETALAWLHELFDSVAPLPWPQTTVVHGHPGSPGRVDPMLVAPDSNDRESIVEQVGRLYLARAIAVAPVDSAWLDEGLARFQGDLYAETQGRRWIYPRLERLVLEQELAGEARPVLPPAGAEPGPDRARRAEFLFYQLRWAVGDPAMRAILHAYWARARFAGARESLFVAVADSVTGADFGRRFAAALRESGPVDYAVGRARRVHLADGRWRTTVEVRRRGGGQFPLLVRVEAAGDTASAWAPGVRDRDTVMVVTATRPSRVVLDPNGRTHDWNVLNNRKVLGAHLGPAMAVDTRLGGYFSTPAPRDRLARARAPLAWYNDAGGWTFGLRTRDDYLGRFNLDLTWVTVATGLGGEGVSRELSGGIVLRNPTGLRAPGLTQRFEVAAVEGRAVGSAALAWTRGLRSLGVAVGGVDVYSAAYLDSAVYERAATYELNVHGSIGTERPGARVTSALAVTGGYAVRHAPAPGVRARSGYGRIVAQATGERTLGLVHLRARAFGGAALARGAVPRQRRMYFAGADPYELLENPFLRSRGALFLRPDFHYHAPGGAGLRALDPALGGSQAYGLSLEVEQDLLRGDGGLGRRVAIAVFGDGALGDGDLDPAGRDRLRGVADAGVGLRLDHRLGQTAFQTRLDLPLWLSAPALAQDRAPGGHRVGFRWTFSFLPSF